MATRKPPRSGGYDDEPREPHVEEGSAVKVHREYLKHRLGGGEAASPDAYRRALEQFEKLPGAMRSTPDISGSKVEPEPDETKKEK